jgi:hypothetical protein
MPSLNPTLLSDARILAGYLIFFGSYFVFLWLAFVARL